MPTRSTVEIRARERGVVHEAVLEQDLDRRSAHVHRRRAVADGPDPGDAIEGIETAKEELALVRRLELRERLVHPAVVAELVAAVADRPHQLGIREHGVAGHEERRRDPAALEHGEDPRDREGAELAARERRHVATGHAERPRRHRVEVEREADGQRCGHHATSAPTHASSATRVPSTWVASGMLGCGERLPATSSGRLGRWRKPAGSRSATDAWSAVYIAALQR